MFTSNFLSRAVLGALVVCGSLRGFSAPAGTAWTRRAPTINGSVEGSVQVMIGESLTLNGGAVVTEDLLVPGTPSVRLNGQPTYGGTADGTGAAVPANYEIILNGNAALRRVVRRTDAVALSPVAPPPAPTGTRSVTLNAATQSVGDYGTLRNLTVSSGVGQVVVPAGSYGEFTANANAGFTLGVVGARQPSVYHFQKLTLNKQSRLWVVGPVVVTLAKGLELGGAVGLPAQPGWLTLNVAADGLTLNGGATLHGYVNAPASQVTILGNSELAGGLICDRLTVNGGGKLRLLPASAANRPPTIALTSPADNAVLTAPAALMLRAAASDSDGVLAKVEFFRGLTKLGEDSIAPFELAVTGLEAGTYAFSARVTDNLGATADSAPVTVVVNGSNQLPVVVLTSPVGGTLLTAPAVVNATADATDRDGVITRVEFWRNGVKAGEDFTAPFGFSFADLPEGTHLFSARAFDNAGAMVTSAVATVTVVGANQPPVVTILAPVDGAVFSAPAAFTISASAQDADGTIARVELFQGGVKIAESALAPYAFPLSGLAAGNYSFLVRARDNLGAATDSVALAVTVTGVNVPPLVALTAPAEGAVFSAPLTTTLTADASDPDGTVTKVEFFEGARKLGEDTAPPYQWLWSGVPPGTYVLSARATDNFGGTTLSAARRVTVQVALPYFTGFEAAQGFVVGPIAGQAGWAATGVVQVVEGAAREGVRSVLLNPGEPAAQLAHAFPPYTNSDIIFVDCFVRLAADPSVAASSLVQTEFGAVGLLGGGGEAELHVLQGDGFGGGVWQPTGVKCALGPDGQTVAWLRLTLRGDFAARRWDLFVGGRLVAADRGFVQGALSRWENFSLRGHRSAAVAIDDFYGGFENPLFADADRDGLDDAWELAQGLNPTLNDRAGDRDGDGLSNLAEFQLGSKPGVADSDGDGADDGFEVSVGRSPLRGVVADVNGAVNLRLHTPARGISFP